MRKDTNEHNEALKDFVHRMQQAQTGSFRRPDYDKVLAELVGAFRDLLDDYDKAEAELEKVV